MIVRNFLSKPFHELRPLWPRATKAHITLDHIPKRRNLVKSCDPEEPSYASDPWIVVAHPSWSAICLRVGAHGPEFIAIENRAITPNTFLPIENRPRRG